LNKVHRKKKDKSETPSYGIIDSQSVKTVIDSEDIGFDGGKKVKGRKRHIVKNMVRIAMLRITARKYV